MRSLTWLDTSGTRPFDQVGHLRTGVARVHRDRHESARGTRQEEPDVPDAVRTMDRDAVARCETVGAELRGEPAALL